MDIWWRKVIFHRIKLINKLIYISFVKKGTNTQGEKWLTHWGRVTHICVVKLSIIGSDNGLSPGRRQAIIWTNDGILLIGPLGTKFSGILIEIDTFSLKKMHLKMASAKWRPFSLGLNVLMHGTKQMTTFHKDWSTITGYPSLGYNPDMAWQQVLTSILKGGPRTETPLGCV